MSIEWRRAVEAGDLKLATSAWERFVLSEPRREALAVDVDPQEIKFGVACELSTLLGNLHSSQHLEDLDVTLVCRLRAVREAIRKRAYARARR